MVNLINGVLRDERMVLIMKNPQNADVEIAFGVGAVTTVLTEGGIITSGGIVTGMVAQAGAATGMTAIANLGSCAAAACGMLGPAGWIVIGIGGAAMIIHGIYRGS